MTNAGGGRAIRPRLVLAICLGSGFATLIDQAILTMALPSIRASLEVSTTDLQWIMAVYSLTFGMVLVPAGRLGDRFGRRWFLVGGLTLFSLASLVGATAPDAKTLIIARLVQGVGAGVANPQVIGLIQDVFAGTDRARALGAYATTGAVSGLAAPLIGGLILTLAGPSQLFGFPIDGWRWVLALNVPVGLTTAVLASRWLPRARPAPSERPSSLDLPGVALFGLMTLALMLAVVGSPIGDVPAWTWVAAAALLGIALWQWERVLDRRGRPGILLPELFRARTFVMGTAVAMFCFGALLAGGIVLVVLLQDGLGLSPLEAGLLTAPGAVASATVSLQSHRLVERFGRSLVTWAVIALVTLEVALLSVILVAPSGWLIPAVAGLHFLTAGCGGLIHAPNQSLTLAEVPRGANGLAAGFMQVSQRVSSTVSLAAVTGLAVVGMTVASGSGLDTGADDGGAHLEASRQAAASGTILVASMLAAAAVCSALARGRAGRVRDRFAVKRERPVPSQTSGQIA